MHAAMHTSGNTCALDLAVYTETLPDDDALAAAWYYTPIASLRNRALAMAETDVCGACDSILVQSFLKSLFVPMYCGCTVDHT